MNWKWLLAIAAILIVLYSSLFTVGASEYVYLTQFGRRVAILDGGSDADSVRAAAGRRSRAQSPPGQPTAAR